MKAVIMRARLPDFPAFLARSNVDVTVTTLQHCGVASTLHAGIDCTRVDTNRCPVFLPRGGSKVCSSRAVLGGAGPRSHTTSVRFDVGARVRDRRPVRVVRGAPQSAASLAVASAGAGCDPVPAPDRLPQPSNVSRFVRPVVGQIKAAVTPLDHFFLVATAHRLTASPHPDEVVMLKPSDHPTGDFPMNFSPFPVTCGLLGHDHHSHQDAADPPRHRRYTVRELPFDYEDPYANGEAGRIEDELRGLESIGARHYGQSAGHRRKRLSRMDFDNPATRRYVEQLESGRHWLSLIPSPAALHPIYEPETSHYPGGVPVCNGIREWFRNVADARGIRSRAAVVEQLLDRSIWTSGPHAHWLSLGCGAARPVMRSLKGFAAAGGPTPSATFADHSASSLQLVQDYAGQQDLRGHVQTVQAHILDPRGFKRLATGLPGWRRASGWMESFDVVEAVGLLEYLKPGDWGVSTGGLIGRQHMQSGAVTFLRRAFECVRPGGLLVVGNMLDSHPQLGFTMDVIQWPHIQPRSVAEMLDIFDAAGLVGHVDIHRPEDGVYAVYAIHKAT